MDPPCYRHRILRVFIIPSKLNNITQTFLSNFLRPLNLRMRSVHTSCFFLPLGYRRICASLSANPCFASGRFAASHICQRFFETLWSSPRTISTGQLHTLLHFHLRPIYQVVFLGPYLMKSERSHLRGSFTLRCFQRLSRPYIATQLCPWQDNWCTRGTSIPVLSY